MPPQRGSSTNLEDSVASSKRFQSVPIACHLVDQSVPLSLCNLDIPDSFSFNDIDTGESFTEKFTRPRVVLSKEDEFLTFSGNETCSTVYVLRPRAVLSSPENDDLLSLVQEHPKKASTIHLPKAPLSPPEDIYGNASGVLGQSPTKFSLSPVSKLDEFQAATASMQSPCDPISKCKNQDETKGKSSTLTSTIRKPELTSRKLSREYEKPSHEKGNKNQIQKKGLILAPKTNIEKGIDDIGFNTKSRKKTGSQGVRPWY